MNLTGEQEVLLQHLRSEGYLTDKDIESVHSTFVPEVIRDIADLLGHHVLDPIEYVGEMNEEDPWSQPEHRQAVKIALEMTSDLGIDPDLLLRIAREVIDTRKKWFGSLKTIKNLGIAHHMLGMILPEEKAAPTNKLQAPPEEAEDSPRSFEKDDKGFHDI